MFSQQDGIFSAYDLSPDSAFSGYSGAAVSLQQRAVSTLVYLEDSRALFGDRAEVMSQISGLLEECRDAGWDGGGALPVAEPVIARASDVIRHLPRDISVPSIAPEPDGAMNLEWFWNKANSIVCSLDASGNVSYAWRLGADRGYAAGIVIGGRLPESLLGLIRIGEKKHAIAVGAS